MDGWMGLPINLKSDLHLISYKILSTESHMTHHETWRPSSTDSAFGSLVMMRKSY